MTNKVSMDMPKSIGETEEYAIGYKHGLSHGIFNTLNYMVNNGYINDYDFWKLKEEIEKLMIK